MKTRSHRQSPVGFILRLVAVFALVLAAGCVVTSVYPYYQEKDLVFEPGLVGKWVDAATNTPDSYVIIKPNGGRGYWATVYASKETNRCEVHLFRLHSQLFLDTFPTNRPLDYVPVHQISKVLQIHPTLKTADLNYDWLARLFDQKPKAIRHIVLQKPGETGGKGRIVLTADTPELQRFIMKYRDDTNAWNGISEFKRLE